MNYYGLLGLRSEPFSTSPDPDFFFESRDHHTALVRLMIEIRLKRGMSVIIGDVGTGKTTLSRKLLQMLKSRKDIVVHLILDPVDGGEEAFLVSLLRAFNIPVRPSFSALDCKEAIKRYLFQKAAREKRTVVLMIDEGQKLTDAALEILRTLLNYETNEYKLLQLVILAQTELLPRISGMKNFWDRISFKHLINPLDLQATKGMIEFRLRQAGYTREVPVFSDEVIAEIHRHAQGCPRRIGMLCHNTLKALIVDGHFSAEQRHIKDVISEDVLVTV